MSDYFSEKAAIHHYYGTAMKTWSEYLQGDTVRYKKYYYLRLFCQRKFQLPACLAGNRERAGEKTSGRLRREGGGRNAQKDGAGGPEQ